MNNKLKHLKSIIAKNRIDAVLISSVPNIIYLDGYSGFSYFEREAFLLISKKIVTQPQGLAHKTPGVFGYLITDGRYSEAVSKIPYFGILEISNKNSLDDIFKSLSKNIKKIGIEEYNISLSESKKLKKYFKLIPSKDLRNLRIIKEKNEVLKIKKACQIGDEAFDFIVKKIKSGITEKELAFKLEYFIKKKHADISFPPIVAFGKNSSIPHHQTSSEKLRTNSIVLLDFGVKFENYCSDMTRTVFFGKADEKFKKIYNTTLESQQKAIKFLNSSFIIHNSKTKPVKTASIDKAARQYIIRSGYPTIPHSLGHGIGIDVHESPRLSPKSKDILKEGMVFSIEPGIYIPNYGGVRIEDIVVLENKGICLLTHSPKHLIEI